jgi:DNA-binding HxlR family transcriptional regulator
MTTTRAIKSGPPRAHRLRGDGAIRERHCSVGRTIDVIGDGWTFMVLRECYFGIKRFDAFKEALGLPRTTLSHRLKSLTAIGILKKTRYQTRPLRFEYRLTEAGLELYSVMLALMSFGDRWLAGGQQKPLQLVHRTCGQPCTAEVICSACHAPILPQQVTYREGPGAGSRPMRIRATTRRSADSTALERHRPSSVARALQVIGDRWSFMILREAFLKTRRFDDLQTRLGITPNILADRLNRLVAADVFTRVQYQTGPDRFEYRFTPRGRDLYGPMLVMLHWGDRWLSAGKPPLLLTHTACGQDFHAVVACDGCGGDLRAHEMRYVMHYTVPAGNTD